MRKWINSTKTNIIGFQKGEKMTNTVVIQERTDNKGLLHRIEIPLMTYLTEHDLEPVVRCKNCKYLEEDECPWTGVIDWNGYCSRGERKEDVETN